MTPTLPQLPLTPTSSTSNKNHEPTRLSQPHSYPSRPPQSARPSDQLPPPTPPTARSPLPPMSNHTNLSPSRDAVTPLSKIQSPKHTPPSITEPPFRAVMKHDDVVLENEAGPSDWNRLSLSRKRKWAMNGYNGEEIDALEARSTSLNLALLLDQQSTLFPEPPTKFISGEDVVQRLLPWHVWQIVDEELDIPENEAKDNIRRLKDTADVKLLVGRMTDINHRLHKLRQREAERPNDLPSIISITTAATSSLRDEVALLNNNLRVAQHRQSALEAESRRRIEAQRAAMSAKSTPGTPSHPSQPSRPSSSVRPGQSQSSQPLPSIQSTQPAQSSRPNTSAPDHTTALRTALENAVGKPSTPLTSASLPTRSSTPDTPDTPTPSRGKLKSRPKGRTRAGLRESLLTHSITTPNGSPSSASTASSRPSSPSNKDGTSSTTTNGTSVQSPATQGPVTVTVSKQVIQQFHSLGILNIPPKSGVKSPANIISATEDGKHIVSVNLALCSQTQLASLAKMFNVPWKGSTATVSSGSATPNGTPRGKGK
ncbi:hypothetical protein TREMEDRAFT_66193 [Tremella mesenterica DSM 1558]|uniref:uncharacterized protein n=1 Tax=Tremella mesenterica (strain ATCC 24925 / CBS 8224 / DSM 1558 / NBRC 9311 / NRRL Y-6157 / RJB 2259-6 / UBC 559-6) TaxID=578456 RepID=UPI00032C4246|nr:uncharacterized protein TREMEDRAFT_66193 [Tremella mesenterica DSM 1558]EIW65824.1 hypothetical protein TREMEDRAFT_66193 [Tremella mesenterica DSM 1558]